MDQGKKSEKSLIYPVKVERFQVDALGSIGVGGTQYTLSYKLFCIIIIYKFGKQII